MEGWIFKLPPSPSLPARQMRDAVLSEPYRPEDHVLTQEEPGSVASGLLVSTMVYGLAVLFIIPLCTQLLYQTLVCVCVCLCSSPPHVSCLLPASAAALGSFLPPPPPLGPHEKAGIAQASALLLCAHFHKRDKSSLAAPEKPQNIPFLR